MAHISDSWIGMLVSILEKLPIFEVTTNLLQKWNSVIIEVYSETRGAILLGLGGNSSFA